MSSMSRVPVYNCENLVHTCQAMIAIASDPPIYHQERVSLIRSTAPTILSYCWSSAEASQNLTYLLRHFPVFGLSTTFFLRCLIVFLQPRNFSC